MVGEWFLGRFGARALLCFLVMLCFSPAWAFPEALDSRPTSTFSKNTSKEDQDFAVPSSQTVPSRKALAKRLGKLKVTTLTKRDFSKSSGVSGGENAVFTDLPEGYLVGPTGMGPCIGVLVFTEQKRGDPLILAFHFTAMDSPERTFSDQGPFPKDARAAIAGGDGTPESNVTLWEVVNALATREVQIEGFAPYAALWMNRRGAYFAHALDVKLGTPLERFSFNPFPW